MYERTVSFVFPERRKMCLKINYLQQNKMRLLFPVIISIEQ